MMTIAVHGNRRTVLKFYACAIFGGINNLQGSLSVGPKICDTVPLPVEPNGLLQCEMYRCLSRNVERDCSPTLLVKEWGEMVTSANMGPSSENK
jgi:hypothetical protein